MWIVPGRTLLNFFHNRTFSLDCKTVRIFAYSSTREQPNKRSGTKLKIGRDAPHALHALPACETLPLPDLKKKTRLFCSLPSCRIGRLGLDVSSYPDFSPLPLMFFFRASFSGLRSNHVVVVMRSPNNHDGDGNGNQKVKRAEGDNFARAHTV